MADKLGLGSEVRELKLGSTFTNPRSTAFHSIRYDFKPASVDLNKKATVEIGNNNQVTVSVPHLDGAGPQTLFKGSQKPYQKECVLIIDRVTGEITLEKLSSNIQVKKTRSESYKLPAHSHSNRPVTPVDHGPPVTQRVSSKTKVASGSRRNPNPIGLVPKHSPLHASPIHHASPSSRPQDRHHNNEIVSNVNNSSNNHSMLASLPMIGLDDIDTHTHTNTIPNNTTSNSNSSLVNNSSSRKQPSPPQLSHTDDEKNGIGILSDSSSSSSSDSGSSDSETKTEKNGIGILSDSSSSSSSDSGSSDSESETEPPKPTSRNNNSTSTTRPINGKSPGLSLPDHLLTEDLCLSESNTDSD